MVIFQGAKSIPEALTDGKEGEMPNIDHSLPRCPDCELSHSVFINDDGNIECLMCGRIANRNGKIIRPGWTEEFMGEIAGSEGD